MNLDARSAHQRYGRPVRQLFMLVLLVLLAGQLAISLYAWSSAEQRLRPELARKAHTVALSLSLKLGRALDYGIALDRLTGVDEYFTDVVRENPDIAYLTLTDMAGKELFRSAGAPAERLRFDDTSADIARAGVSVARLHVGVERAFIATSLRELRYDLGVVVLTSVLMAFEVLWFVVTLTVTAPLRQLVALMLAMAAGDFGQRAPARSSMALGDSLNRLAAPINQAFARLAARARRAPARAAAPALLAGLRARYRFGEDGVASEAPAQRVVLVRVLCLLFMFAEMLARPFLPQYANTLAAPGLSAGMHASLPISVFLLSVALAMPTAGRWSDQLGRRRSYMAGALCVAGALAGTALLPEYGVLLLARALSGVGYALMFMACQGYVLDNTDARDQGQGMALFVGAIMVAEICAPAIGGILADRIGYRMVFWVGAGVALLAALLAGAVLAPRSGRLPAPPAPTLTGLLRRPRFLALALLSGVPAKFLYAGFLIFLVPLLLSELGHSKAEIGRYSMLYGLSALALAPLFGRLADRYRIYMPMVALGGMLSGAGLLRIALGIDADAVMLGILLLGVGQAMSISAQLILVTQQGAALGQGAVLGMFRLIERLGAAAGPVLAGLSLAAFGAARTCMLMAVFTLVCSLLFALVFAMTRSRP